MSGSGFTSTADLPAIQAASYGSTTATYSLGSGVLGTGQNFGQQMANMNQVQEPYPWATIQDQQSAFRQSNELARTIVNQQLKLKPEKVKTMSARIVRIFVIDPDSNIPLEKRVIYKSEEQLTELTNEELWITEVPVKKILDDHNAYRITVPHKKNSAAKEKDVMLEPAKVRDLKMIVVDVVGF